MKSITFIRHAKSSWEHQLPDHKRPLNKRGLFAAEFMSSLEIVKSIQPDAVVILFEEQMQASQGHKWLMHEQLRLSLHS